MILFCCSVLISVAQDITIDSLKSLLSSSTDDTTKVMLLSDLCQHLQRSNTDSAFLVGEQGLELAQKIKYERGILFCTIALSGTWWSIGDYSTAIKLLLPYVPVVEKYGDLEAQNGLYSSLYNEYRDEGDYKEALVYAYKLLPISVSFNHCQYCRIQYAAIAVVYLEVHQLDSANAYIQKSLQAPASLGFNGYTYLVAGRIMVASGRYDEAFRYYRRSIQELQMEHNLKDLSGAYNNMANLFQQRDFPDSAIAYAQQALMVAQPKQFAREKMEASLILSKVYEHSNIDSAYWYQNVAMAAKDSLYNLEKQRQLLSYQFNEELRQQEALNKQQQYQTELRLYALMGVLFLIISISIVLYRSNQHRKKAYALLEKQTAATDLQRDKAEQALKELKSTQAQLIQSEKMASLGELTAGIAHEIQNPLNFVNNFSEVNTELIEELKSELIADNKEEAIQLADDIKENERKIIHHGKRADSIVKGMLQHSRASTGKKELTNINSLVNETLRLSYHGLRAKDKDFNAAINADFDEGIGKININPQDISRVLLNLFNNAFYSVNEKKSKLNGKFEPAVSVCTKKMDGKVEIHVQDNGNGIPENIVDKIFQPFFTTKPTGQGTGLGLSLSYDIIKAHGGEIKVESKEGEESEFIIQLSIV